MKKGSSLSFTNHPSTILIPRRPYHRRAHKSCVWWMVLSPLLLALILLHTFHFNMSLSPSSTKGAQPPPLFKFGLIADVQHAPIPDGASFSGEPRYYRHALSVCESASKHFQNAECDFAINLGDIIGEGWSEGTAAYHISRLQ